MADDDMGRVIGASITASILVALTGTDDEAGKLNQKERDRLVEIVGAGKENSLSPREILTQVEKILSMVKSQAPDAWPRNMAKLAEGLSDESKKLILHAAGNMALVDGEFTEAEQKEIRQIARWIDISEQEFIIWKDEFRKTIKEGVISDMLPDLDYNNSDWQSPLYDS